ncbi:MAG: ergothioneine biosynthesis protein EgtB [Gammaproteobacteria bacterium]|nr:ergothioneine biosynthesis protein EgtB [Gammaproteobacteria bacterium]MDE2345570.1 ergothioneine biosynthesis protein EgtB [Gammaproteobacteria bacterium]
MHIVPDSQPLQAEDTPTLADRYRAVRELSVDLCRTLTPEDFTVQSMPDASPAKWHLAHTSWFFEQFLLQPYLKDYRPFHPQFNFLFNSYYYSMGGMHPRSQRGLITRPGTAQVMEYRAHVDRHMRKLLKSGAEVAELAFLTSLGLNHEQQHQELLLMDIKHLFSCNPLKPAWRELPLVADTTAAQLKFISRPEAMSKIGHDGKGFAFDNETPRHRVFIQAYSLANRLTTNAEYLEFIRAGGYITSSLWLADGWATIQREAWNRPLYWHQDLDREFTLAGEREIVWHAPVCHLSFYEADAFARWADARLPTEAEWESFAADQPLAGNFLDSGDFQPLPAAVGASQLFGDVWEWTASSYAPYPGFKPLAGSLGEYNGKFMSSQVILRGGCCVTPHGHVRASYRNFFYPQQRWQFAGIRLARDK